MNEEMIIAVALRTISSLVVEPVGKIRGIIHYTIR